MGKGRVYLALLVALMAGCDADEPPAAEDQPAADAEATATDGASDEVPSEVASSAGDGRFVGVITSSDGFPVRVAYRKVGELAVVGGDMIVGTHAELQRRLALLSDLSDGDLAPDSAAPSQAAAAEQLAAAARQQGANVLAPSFAKRLPNIFGWGTLGQPWPALVIPYRIGPSIPAGVRQDNIAAGVRIWNASAPVKLKPAAEVSAAEQQRLGVLEFVDHEDEDSTFACSSFVGYRVRGGRQQLFLNPSCKPGNIAHEIGHAMGLEHEHARTDRAALLAVASEVADDYAAVRGRQLSTHDLCSIMHYSPKVSDPPWFSLTAAGQAALTTCSAGLPASCRSVGQRCQLSATDVASLATLYR